MNEGSGQRTPRRVQEDYQVGAYKETERADDTGATIQEKEKQYLFLCSFYC